MRIEDAMEQLSAIHVQVLRSETFRGYRAGPVAVTGGLALAAALVQELIWTAPDMGAFVLFWSSIALVSGLWITGDLLGRALREGSAGRQHTWLALRQLVPALAVGAVLTVALLGGDAAPRLPGIWALCFGLGVVASRPFLPASIGYVALFYLVAGAALLLPQLCLPMPAPLAMGLVFGLGQGLAAFVLHRAEEQRRG